VDTWRRLTGIRTPYAAAPAGLHAWVSATLGVEVVTVLPRVGGQSPAVAASLELADGTRAFVKAVWPEVNPVTPSHFRLEMQAYAAMGPAPWRADVLATRDGEDWVAILLEDLPGGHPDLTDPVVAQRVLDSVQDQTAELSPVPHGAPTDSLLDSLSVIEERIDRAGPADLALLPPWAQAGLDQIRERVAALRAGYREEALVNFDVRWDNMLLRADGQPVFVDWGQARRGPRWCDVVIYGLEWAREPAYDALLVAAGLTDRETEEATAFLGGFGVFLTLANADPAPQGLPNLPAFRQDTADRCLAAYARRTQP
jgi:hypothetical protein